MNFANPTLGLTSSYLVVSVLISFLISVVVVYWMRQRSPAAVSYKTFAIVFVVAMTLMIMRKLI